jgi:hypothetical protein
MLGTVCTAENSAVLLYAMTNNTDPTMRAGGCKSGDRALKTIENMRFAIHGDFEGLVVVVAAL